MSRVYPACNGQTHLTDRNNIEPYAPVISQLEFLINTVSSQVVRYTQVTCNRDLLKLKTSRNHSASKRLLSGQLPGRSIARPALSLIPDVTMRGRSCIINHPRLPRWESVFRVRSFSRDLEPGQHSHSTLVENTCHSQRLLFRLAHSFLEGTKWLSGEARPYYSVPRMYHAIVESLIA